jgi:hypothetical protein
MFAIFISSYLLRQRERMRLTRREILEQLERLGVRRLSELKKACREFEAYWNDIQCSDLG